MITLRQSSLLWTDSYFRIECVYDFSEILIFAVDRLMFE